MTKNTRIAAVTAVVAVVIVVAIYFGIDFYKSKQRCFDCGDGQRCSIDTREFATQYSAYSVELEASVEGKGKLSTKISPSQVQQLSEAFQASREFRKYVVHGFNACAVSKVQYEELGKRLQALDSLAREINGFADKTNLTGAEKSKLSLLIGEYAKLSQKLAS